MAFDTEKFLTMSASQAQAYIAAASDADLKAAFQGPQREHILDSMFDQLPSRFLPAKAGDASNTVDINLTDGPSGTQTYRIQIADGKCTIAKDPGGTADLSVTGSSIDLVKILAGSANPMKLMMFGKVKPSGNLALGASFATWFDRS